MIDSNSMGTWLDPVINELTFFGVYKNNVKFYLMSWSEHKELIFLKNILDLHKDCFFYHRNYHVIFFFFFCQSTFYLRRRILRIYLRYITFGGNFI